MDNFYVACHLGVDRGRVMLGTLQKSQLLLCEIRRFDNVPVEEGDSLQWNIAHLHGEMLEGLRGIGAHEEPVDGISCSSWGGDYLLFDRDGALMTPAYHHADARTAAGMKNVCARIPWATIYEETGVQGAGASTLFQLGAEPSRRLGRATHLMPIADGFNYLLAGIARVERSMASTTQLYNPVTRDWSVRLLEALGVSRRLFPEVVPAGTVLGDLRKELERETGLEGAQVVSSCSHETAAGLAGLPIVPGEAWAYLRWGSSTLLGTQVGSPVINEASREWRFTNEAGHGGSICFQKETAGWWMIEECKQFWREKDRELADDVVMHLAIAAEPFESLINLEDPRFREPGDMPLKIQAYCKETGQHVPRKPGPILRCILESLALSYRKTVCEMEHLTGQTFKRVYMFGDQPNMLLMHFTANALQVPLTIASPDVAAIGNVVVQALALGHIKSIDQAREIVRNSFKSQTIIPHATAWNEAYERLTQLLAA